MSETETGKDGLPIRYYAAAEDWERWLEAEHATSPGVWIKMTKKGSGIPSVTYAEALDAALCYGWIDGQSRGVDDTYYLQRFTRRGPRSPWSKINREKVAALIEQGRMRPAGAAQIEAAQRDGRWDAAYDSPATAVVPADLEEALDRCPAAREFFATLKGQNRYAILHRIQEAKKPETRVRRIEKFVAMLAEGKTVY
jgi:uncharacterized protein YdeI (YjbR/CyaY-like superfamily)